MSNTTIKGSGPLFNPLQLGAISLDHRIVMAPLTRMRTVKDFIPNDLMVEYYSQRATKGGLQIAEATVVSETGHGYYGAPGIYTTEHVAGWKKVTGAVHAKGGYIFLQLFHAGRASHTEMQPGGAHPIGASAVPHNNVVYTPTGWKPASPNRALEISEIAGVIQDFYRASELAKQAGFDGVELHGANGYLIDQFLQDGTNKRTDSYGGSVENRVRFLLEVVNAMVSVWGGDRVGVRLSPSGSFGEMSDSDPERLFAHAAEQLNAFHLAYLHIVEPRVNGSTVEVEGLHPIASQQLRKIFHNRIISAGGFEIETANEAIENGDADLVAFGRHFIANPDLVKRYAEGLPLNAYDRSSFYGGDEHGYTDYPFYEQQ
ncbi:alkene reductase [Mucilaginibacter sp. CAU 1740]|uniref:alkene reductase n=1 Tax=Mucilaginibacter sp. CAU 1740 TaxID=3140365 RepID=UPI00325A76CF